MSTSTRVVFVNLKMSFTLEVLEDVGNEKSKSTTMSIKYYPALCTKINITQRLRAIFVEHSSHSRRTGYFFFNNLQIIDILMKTVKFNYLT